MASTLVGVNSDQSWSKLLGWNRPIDVWIWDLDAYDDEKIKSYDDLSVSIDFSG